MSEPIQLQAFEGVNPTPEFREFIDNLMARVGYLEGALAKAQAKPVALPTPIVPQEVPSLSFKEPKIALPAPFSGRKDDVTLFFHRCNTVFKVQPKTYALDETKLAFVTTLLNDKAIRWLLPFQNQPAEHQPEWLQSWFGFQEEFTKIFGETNSEHEARDKLLVLRQTGSASDYAAEFRRLIAYTDSSDGTQKHTYFVGLKVELQERLLSTNRFTDINQLIEESISWDNLLLQNNLYRSPIRNERHTAYSYQSAFRQRYPHNEPVYNNVPLQAQGQNTPMEVDAVRQRREPLAPEVKEYRRINKLCSYCGKAGHGWNNCRAKPHISSQARYSQVNAVESNLDKVVSSAELSKNGGLQAE